MTNLNKKLSTVTLAISAFNEENNIVAFLKSVLKQKEKGFRLEKILIISDGSNDKTVEMAKSVKSKIITIIHNKERLGKSTRLNQIYSLLTSDYLVQSDADVIFSHPYIIRDIVAPLIKNKKVGMCGGNPYPIKGKTFVENAVNTTFFAYAGLRKTVHGGNNVFSADGRLLSYRKALVKKILIPYDMIANDAYTYFCCSTNKYQYRFVQTAVVLFRSPQTLKDQIRQNTRFLATKTKMIKYFPKSLVKKEYSIPGRLLIKNLAVQFLKHPIECVFIFIINRYCHVRAIIKEKSMTAKWEMADSTKSLL